MTDTMDKLDDGPALLGLWRRCTQHGPAAAAENKLAARALYRRGIAMQETLQLLYGQQPSLDVFTAWIAARTRIAASAPVETDHRDVLSAADLRCWDSHGYVVLRGAVPRAQCDAAGLAIWEYLGASALEPASWYQPHPGKQGMMLQFSDHPALQANRRVAAIRHAYQQLYRRHDSGAIYPTVDKVSFNPPETAHYRYHGSALHWDVSLQQPIPFKLQGLLYLGDCTAADGAFHCVPGFVHDIGPWLASVPPGRQPRDWAEHSLRPVPVEGRAGDFIIWHQALPHCASANRGALPRMVQYLTYLPEQEVDQPVWI